MKSPFGDRVTRKMTKFKCKVTDLENLCNLVSCKGKNIEGKEYSAILDCVVNAIGGKLIVQAMDMQRTFGVKVEQNATVETEGQISIGDLGAFSKFLSRFLPTDEVTIYDETNRIVISRESPKKTAKFPLAAYESISSKDAIMFDKLVFSPSTNYPVMGKANFNLSILVNAEFVKSMFEDGDLIKQRYIPIKVSGNKLSVSVKDDTLGEFETEIVPDAIDSDPEHVGKKEMSAMFGNGFDNIFSNLSGKVSVYLIDEVDASPLIVKQENSQFKFLAMLAPYVSVE